MNEFMQILKYEDDLISTKKDLYETENKIIYDSIDYHT